MKPTVLVVTMLLSAAAAVGQAQHTTNTNVTTIVHDYDPTDALMLFRSDDYNGSQQATYASALNGAVGSYLDSTGEWRFNLYTQKTGVRTVFITPNMAIDGRQPVAPPAGYYWQNVEVYSGCFDQNGNRVSYLNVVTSSGNCSFGADFNYSGTVYKLLMSPSGVPPSGASCPSGGCPATGLAVVVCTAVSNGQCANWTIAPNATASNANVANLFRYSSSKGAAWIYVGQYFNTFRIDVTNP